MKCTLMAAAIAATLALAYDEVPDAPSNGPGQPSTSAKLDVEYATAKLKLAEASLARVERLNQRVSNAVPANVIADYRRDLAIAQQRLAEATRGAVDSFRIWQDEAERSWKSADAAWRSAVAANQRQPGTIPAIDVERLRLRSEVFRVNYERGATLVDRPREEQLAWRLSTLSDQLEQVSEVILRGSPTRPGPPVGDYRYWEYYNLPPTLR
jgi:hypothetical protein